MATHFILIETFDVKILGVRLFVTPEKADEVFGNVTEENGATEWSQEEVTTQCAGTLRMAGDGVYAVQLLGVEVE